MGVPELIYKRDGGMVRLRLKSLTNHELREIMVGLAFRLDPEDREDHIRELTVYHTDPDSWLSPVASAIRDGEDGESVIDVDTLIRQEHGQ